MDEGRHYGMKGNPELTELQQEFLDWLCDPNKQGTQNNWAAEHGLHHSTLSQWKRRDRLFRKAWDKRMAEVYSGPEQVTEAMKVLYAKAMDGDMKALDLYFKRVDKMSPPKIADDEDENIVEMSTEDLERKLRAV